MATVVSFRRNQRVGGYCGASDYALSADELMLPADTPLYRVKTEGRDKVILVPRRTSGMGLSAVEISDFLPALE